MKAFSISIVLLFLLTVLISACASPTPTPTPVPPTATPVPPTNVPPTVAAPSGNPAAEGTLAQALGKARDAKTYRVNLSITGKGNFMAAGGPTPTANANEPVTLVTMQGEVNHEDAHFVIQGLLTSFLGIDPTKPFEVISANGNAYVKGPVPLVGATEEKWYQAPPQAASIAQPPLSSAAFLNSFGEAGINPSDFKLSGTETLDGKQCEVYAGDKAAVVNAFNKLGGSTGATQEDLDSIENAEFKFWVCDDGYLHKVKMAIEGHDQTAPTQKGAFELLLQLSDFEGDITINPPADAIPLQLPTAVPQESVATPTP